MTASGRCSQEPIETIICFYCSMYFKGNQLKQTCFTKEYTLNLIKTTGLTYSLNESSSKCFLNNENNR